MAETTEKSNYYAQAMPPVRDTRLQIADTFSGCACEMSKCLEGGCALRKNRSFWQTNACQMSLTLMMCSTVQNSVVVMHGPIGCGTQLHGLSANAQKGKVNRGLPDQKTPVWLSSNLGETDVINGGEKKLQETIEYADRTYRPEIIFVVATCAPNIIGDDVEKVVDITNKTCAAQVTALHCPGFRSRVVASAYDSFYHSLIRHINFKAIPYKDYVPDNPQDPAAQLGEEVFKYKIAHTVNLFNATSNGYQDEQEMFRLLTALGLNVRVYAEYSSADDFRLLPLAALNVSLCNMHDDYMLKFLEKEYNMPYIIEGMPIGPEQTRKWLVAIGKFFGLEKEANLLADYEEKKLEEAVDEVKDSFAGKRVFLGGGSVRVAA
ncbi:MAG: nitrogenase iron-molybdenum protein subunit alpha, partial [Lachnospiraceae bacterium]|nr:nitrogenase iron-molybdenum protein subunit alpha [Lachnospiraceae bacterium]